MIAVNEPPTSISTKPENHAAFVTMLSTIRRAAQISFRKVRPELRDELIEEVVANAFVGYARLVAQGQADRALPSPLARFAIAQVRAGRRVGNRLRIREVLSHYAQYQKGFRVERLDVFDEEENCWEQIVVEDRRATPADVAACRLDFSAWLRLLPRRRRKIALALAAGETTKGAAEQFGLSPARISQLREWLKKSWEVFQGGSEVGGRTQPVAA
jgi:hypothetical protein